MGGQATEDIERTAPPRMVPVLFGGARRFITPIHSAPAHLTAHHRIFWPQTAGLHAAAIAHGCALSWLKIFDPPSRLRQHVTSPTAAWPAKVSQR